MPTTTDLIRALQVGCRRAEQCPQIQLVDRQLELLALAYATAWWLNSTFPGPGTEGCRKVKHRVGALYQELFQFSGGHEQLYDLVMRLGLALEQVLLHLCPGHRQVPVGKPLSGVVHLRRRSHRRSHIADLRSEWRDSRRMTYDLHPRHYFCHHEIWWEPEEKPELLCYSDEDARGRLHLDSSFNMVDEEVEVRELGAEWVFRDASTGFRETLKRMLAELQGGPPAAPNPPAAAAKSRT